MNQRLNRIGKLLQELEDWLSLMESLELELERQDVSAENNEGLDGLIEILEAARAKAEQEESCYELLFEESAPDECVAWLAGLPGRYEFLWKTRARS